MKGIMKTSIMSKESQARHEEFVRLVDMLMKTKFCNKVDIAFAAGLVPSNFTSYYNNKKAVSDNTLDKIRALRNVKIKSRKSEEKKTKVEEREIDKIKKMLLEINGKADKLIETMSKEIEDIKKEREVLYEAIRMLDRQSKKN